MLNESLEISKKRQAIERALGQFLPESILERVLNYWEQEYGEKPTFVLNRFVNDICNTADLQNQRKEMLRNVLQELAYLEKEALIQEPRTHTEKVNVVEPEIEEEISVNIADACLYFTEEVMKQVSKKDLNDFQHDVKQYLLADGLAIDSVAAIDSRVFIEWLPITYYASWITTLYRMYCEFYGPIKSDQLYAGIKQRVQQQFPDVDLRELL
jgi:hypothetical protein